ncbi:MAG: hypothetical protein OEX19_00360 [Gammaproteobacteria bacterium]|nr:hypothetical protein [Gammaproteobacteria bacterium]
MISRQQQKGASLLEVLISLSLLVSGVLAYFQLDARLINNNHLIAQKTEATQLLQQQLATRSLTGNPGDSGTETIDLNSQSYDITWSIEDSSFGRAVNVAIDWKDNKGEFSDQTHLELTTYNSQIDTLALSLLPPPTPIQP